MGAVGENVTGSLRGLQIAAVMAALSGHPAFIAADQSSPAPRSTLVYAGADGKLQYRTDENGNRIPDFSTCGYGGGGMRIPDVPAKITLSPSPIVQDDTARIQQAIDQVSQMPPDKVGLRGAILLKRGQYRIAGQLKITAGGVALRGEGDDEDGTLLIAAGKTRRDLIDIKGPASVEELIDTRQVIADPTVPVGARSFIVANASAFRVGET